MSAFAQALRAVARELMRNHLKHCATLAIRSGDEDAEVMYDELVDNPAVKREPVEKIIQCGNQSRQKARLRKVPLPVPVGMRDQMEGVPGHGPES